METALTSTNKFTPIDLSGIRPTDLPGPLARIVKDLAAKKCRSENYTNHSYYSDEPRYDHSRVD